MADDSIEVGKEEYALYWPTCEFKPFGYDDVDELCFVNRSNDKLMWNDLLKSGKMVNNSTAVNSDIVIIYIMHLFIYYTVSYIHSCLA